jgi:hypothetical protein
MGCIALVRCVLVLRCGSAGTVWYPYAGWSTSASAFIRIPNHTTVPQPNHTVTQTHIEREQYNPLNNSTNKSQDPEDGCTNTRNMLSIKYWNKKASDIKLVCLYLTTNKQNIPTNPQCPLWYSHCLLSCTNTTHFGDIDSLNRYIVQAASLISLSSVAK